MGLSIKVVCVLLVIGCAGLFILKKPDGTPILSANEFLPDIAGLTAKGKTLIDQLNDQLTLATSPAIETAETEQPTGDHSTIYRWKDSNGQWQFSDKPPTHQTAETISVSGNLNRDLSVTYTPPKKEETSNETSTDTPSETSVLPMTVSPDKISKLIEDAEGIQALMDKRTEKLNGY